jgi:molybdenum cofactor cytidylyltransferase
MGADNKLLQQVRGEALVRHAVKAQIASRAAPVFVVVGHQEAEIRAALEGLDVRFVRNPGFADGLSSSLKAGLAALPSDAQGVVVSLGDMPNVTPGVIDRLAQAFADRPDAVAVVPTLLGHRGNPVLLSRGLFAAVARLSGDEGARRLLEEAGDAVEEVPLDDPAIAIDVDTPEALKALTGAPLRS